MIKFNPQILRVCQLLQMVQWFSEYVKSQLVIFAQKNTFFYLRNYLIAVSSVKVYVVHLTHFLSKIVQSNSCILGEEACMCRSLHVQRQRLIVMRCEVRALRLNENPAHVYTRARHKEALFLRIKMLNGSEADPQAFQ